MTEWLPVAQRNFAAQVDWIAEHDPWAAVDVGDTVLRAIDRLADHRGLGRAQSLSWTTGAWRSPPPRSPKRV